MRVARGVQFLVARPQAEALSDREELGREKSRRWVNVELRSQYDVNAVQPEFFCANLICRDRLWSFPSPRSSVRIASVPQLLSPSKPSSKQASPAGDATRPLMKEAACTEIKKRILSGQFPQGRFISDRQLALQLKMIQTPIRQPREAIDRGIGGDFAAAEDRRMRDLGPRYLGLIRVPQNPRGLPRPPHNRVVDLDPGRSAPREPRPAPADGSSGAFPATSNWTPHPTCCCASSTATGNSSGRCKDFGTIAAA